MISQFSALRHFSDYMKLQHMQNMKTFPFHWHMRFLISDSSLYNTNIENHGEDISFASYRNFFSILWSKVCSKIYISVYTTRLPKMFFQGGTALTASDMNNEFYTKWKPVKNGI
jgi:hypothetical protein